MRGFACIVAGWTRSVRVRFTDPEAGLDIAIVVAIADNGVIGAANGLPWRLPTDLRQFRAVTMGKPVIMGRRTWQSIGKPLAGRHNIVISRDPGFRADGADVVRSLEEGLTLAGVRARCAGAGDEACVIGGGEVYAQAMTLADTLHVTHVRATPGGDTHFPPIDPAEWEVVSSVVPERCEKDTAAIEFVTYRRRASVSGRRRARVNG